MENHFNDSMLSPTVMAGDSNQTLPRISFEQIPQYMVMLNSKLDSILSWIARFNCKSAASPVLYQDNHIPMNIDQACQFIGKGHSTLYALTSAKKIPFHKRGNKLYFFKDELLKWIETGGSYEVAPAIESQEEVDFERHLESMRRGKKHKADKVVD